MRTDRRAVPQPVLQVVGVLAVVLGMLLMHGLTTSNGGCHDTGMVMSDAVTTISAPSMTHPDGTIAAPAASAQQMIGATCVTRVEPEQHFPAPLLVLLVVFAIGGAATSWNRPVLPRRSVRQRAPTGRQLLHHLQISRT